MNTAASLELRVITYGTQMRQQPAYIILYKVHDAIMMDCQDKEKARILSFGPQLHQDDSDSRVSHSEF
jgi:hypothetical protein